VERIAYLIFKVSIWEILSVSYVVWNQRHVVKNPGSVEKSLLSSTTPIYSMAMAVARTRQIL
jgi:hypothetical protein